MNKISLLDQIGHVSAFLAVVAMTTYLLNFFVTLVVRASAPALGLAPRSNDVGIAEGHRAASAAGDAPTRHVG